VVSGATAWTCQETAETFVLVANEALHTPESMNDTLLNPNQLQAFRSIAQDNPHSGAPSHVSDAEDTLAIPLSSEGTATFADTRTPTEQESSDCKQAHLTSLNHWNPSRVKFPGAQWTIDEDRVCCIAVIDALERSDTSDEDKSVQGEICNVGHFNQRMISSVRVMSIPTERATVQASSVQIEGPTTPNTFVSKGRRSDVSAETLADRWMIGLEQA